MPDFIMESGLFVVPQYEEYCSGIRGVLFRNSRSLAAQFDGYELKPKTKQFNNDTFWLSQKRMSELFAVDVSTINYHLKQIDESGEVHLSDAIRKIPILSDKWRGNKGTGLM